MLTSSNPSVERNFTMRVLVADDDRGILAAYKVAFASLQPTETQDRLASMAASLFPDAAEDATSNEALPAFDVVFVDQGCDAVAAIEAGLEAGAPFQLAFLDMRMPPGIDGKETARQIRIADPNVHIVVVTGYSDYSPADVAKVAGPADKLGYLVKPFEIDEIVQVARTLIEKGRVEGALRAALHQLEQQLQMVEQTNIELAASEGRARHAAFHDALTGAPNRAFFLHALAERIQARSTDMIVAILDLDRFKLVNDTLGHVAGDEVVREIWSAVQEKLPEGAIGARMGGDEFGFLLPSAPVEETLSLCETLVETCAQEWSIFGHAVRVGASIGVAYSLGGGERDSIDIVRRADLALYAAKRAGRGRAYLYDKQLDESLRFREEIETGLSHAIANHELSLEFQPIVCQQTLSVVGFEALVRWTSQTSGAISPSLFVPIAEESNLIHELSDWVVPRALEACRAWPSQYVSINFSPRQFRRPGLVEHLLEAVSRAGLEPGRVQVEITETALFDDADGAALTLCELQARGFKVALDDFGTGYSSLFNLRNFNIDCIKIDRSFVAALGKEKNSTAIVTSITQLGRSLGLNVVAEGVEDHFQHSALRMAGCSHMQGFLFGRPVDRAEANRLAHQPACEASRPDLESNFA
jgi:diguanylate cyclase (GGDEF)-like protein